MAIELNIETSQYGIPFAAAYYRIVTAAISRTRDEANRFGVMIDVVGYATKPEHDDVREIDFRRYHVPMTDIEAQAGDNFLSKCYIWVSAQSDMTGAINV